jgi:hypothetical protein
MGKRFKSTEVFQANAVTRVAIEGDVVGRYVQTGPNKWDDYELTREQGDERIEISQGARIQVEPLGADPEVRLRLAKGREVLVLRWVVNDEDQQEISSGKYGVQEAEQASRIEKILGLAPKNDPRDDMLEYFLAAKAEAKD